MTYIKTIRQICLEAVQILFGILLASVGLKGFLLPNGFLDGGVTGISILIGELMGVELSYILPIASIPFFVLGWYTVSRRILLKSIFSVLILSLMIHFENFQTITDDKLIISIFGGILLGAGIGLAIRNGSVLDGSEILGIFLNERFGISIGTIILWFNALLFGLTALLLTVEVALYSILTYIVTAKVIDFMMQGFEDYVGLMIASDKSDEIQQQLINKVGPGMTVYQGMQGFGSRGKKEDFQIIHTIINRIDSKRAYNEIASVDKDAFIVEFDVNRVTGGVLRNYLSRNKGRRLSPTLYEDARQAS